MIGVPGIAEKTFALARVVVVIVVVVVQQRPLRCRPEHRGAKIIVARGHAVVLSLGLTRRGFTPPRHRLEGRRDVGIFLHPRADCRDVAGRGRPASPAR